MTVAVLRNNKPLESLEMQRFSPLETGATAASLRYVPKDGWKAGRYTFIVRLETPTFTVKAANEFGLGPASAATSTVTPPATPAAPSGGAASPGSAGASSGSAAATCPHRDHGRRATHAVCPPHACGA